MCEYCRSSRPAPPAPMDRRGFLRLGGTSLVLLGMGRGLSAAGAASSITPAGKNPEGSKEEHGILVVFFQRGAADGLHMVVPYRDKHYRRLRGALALEEPGRGESRTLDLGDGFAFHPALGPLHGLYGSRRLAVVHAVGSPDPTRSHFDAQDYMESGTPGRKSTRDGWLARALSELDARAPRSSSPFRAVALSSTLPRSLAGSSEAIAMEDFSRLGGRGRGTSLAARIERMYREDSHPEFAKAGEEAFRALKLFREKDPLRQPVPEGVTYPRGRIASAFRQLARLLKADLGIRIAFLESGGWDTHFGQGGATGQMANLLRGFAGSVSAFLDDLGPEFPVTLMTVTEFGRTAAVNGAGGTDHGHGTAMMVAGGGVKGGRVAGDWPGLASKNLYEGRDLAVTTDFRDLFSEVAISALSLPSNANLFPDYRAQRHPGVMGS
ncbi:MAG: DUF1501 domain-containing protein [Acidobacteriota bacterium]